MITQYGESKNKKNCQKFEKIYFAGRVLLTLINVLAHSAIGGEPEEKILSLAFCSIRGSVHPKDTKGRMTLSDL